MLYIEVRQQVGVIVLFNNSHFARIEDIDILTVYYYSSLQNYYHRSNYYGLC